MLSLLTAAQHAAAVLTFTFSTEPTLPQSTLTPGFLHAIDFVIFSQFLDMFFGLLFGIPVMQRRPGLLRWLALLVMALAMAVYVLLRPAGTCAGTPWVALAGPPFIFSLSSSS